MRLGRRGVYHCWAEPGARRFIEATRGFDIAIGNGRRLTGWFPRSHCFFGLTALAALLGRRAARWRDGAGRGWRGVLCQSCPSPKAEQQDSKQRASAQHQPATGRRCTPRGSSAGFRTAAGNAPWAVSRQAFSAQWTDGKASSSQGISDQ